MIPLYWYFSYRLMISFPVGRYNFFSSASWQIGPFYWISSLLCCVAFPMESFAFIYQIKLFLLPLVDSLVNFADATKVLLQTFCVWGHLPLEFVIWNKNPWSRVYVDYTEEISRWKCEINTENSGFGEL